MTVSTALSYTSAHEIPTLLFTSSLNRVPLSGGASLKVVHYREYPPPPKKLHVQVSCD